MKRGWSKWWDAPGTARASRKILGGLAPCVKTGAGQLKNDPITTH
ncbi:MAG TPA: hypothetical protein VKF38_13360 [Anaerolineaceae bacterium]|nr:hypothetical protein [Anaerolineaceae bacterium]